MSTVQHPTQHCSALLPSLVASPALKERALQVLKTVHTAQEIWGIKKETEALTSPFNEALNDRKMCKKGWECPPGMEDLHLVPNTE